jgi:hypothetical protein
VTPAPQTAAARYSALIPRREPFLRRARECAALTIPHLVPPSGASSTTTLPTPFQSHGARGVRTLASKLLLALFPNFPFFKYQLDDLALSNLEERVGQENLRGEAEKAMSARERAIMIEAENAMIRPGAFMALMQMIVAGNVLGFIPPADTEGRTKVYRLDQFVLVRAADGSLTEFVIEELVDISTLDPDIAAQASRSPHDPDKGLMYTHAKLNGNRWDVYQEAGGRELPESRGAYPKDRLPWIAPRLSAQPGEEYGRPYVEEFLGDLDSLEALSQAIVEAAGAAARVVYFVDPSGSTSLRVVAQARSGDTVPGNANDISMLRLDKGQDLNVVRAQAESIAQALAYSFLMHTAIQRAGERVTAEEIRTLANELDTALGGVYTLLAVELQLPVVHLLSHRMEKSRGVPALPKDITRPVIVTGLEAIGRGTDQRNLKLFLADLAQNIGPERLFRIISEEELVKRTAASYGIDTNGLIKSAEQQAAEAQATQEQQMMAELGPETIRQAGGMAQTAMAAQQQQEAQ